MTDRLVTHSTGEFAPIFQLTREQALLVIAKLALEDKTGRVMRLVKKHRHDDIELVNGD